MLLRTGEVGCSPLCSALRAHDRATRQSPRMSTSGGVLGHSHSPLTACMPNPVGGARSAAGGSNPRGASVRTPAFVGLRERMFGGGASTVVQERAPVEPKIITPSVDRLYEPTPEQRHVLSSSQAWEPRFRECLVEIYTSGAMQSVLPTIHVDDLQFVRNLETGAYGRVREVQVKNTNLPRLAYKELYDYELAADAHFDALAEALYIKCVPLEVGVGCAYIVVGEEAATFGSWRTPMALGFAMPLYTRLLDFLDGERFKDESQPENGWLPPALLFQLGASLFELLDVMHAFGMVHLDIKPDNLFAEVSPTGQLRVKAGDFGHACAPLQSGWLANHVVGRGTPWFTGPEVLPKLADALPHRFAAVDVWGAMVTWVSLFNTYWCPVPDHNGVAGSDMCNDQLADYYAQWLGKPNKGIIQVPTVPDSLEAQYPGLWAALQGLTDDVCQLDPQQRISPGEVAQRIRQLQAEFGLAP